MKLKLVLASASPRRVELLRFLTEQFEVVPAQVEEFEDSWPIPAEVALLNAWRKARAVQKLRPASLILGADTVVALGSQLLGKPKSLKHAMSMQRTLAGRTHEVLTGVCLLHRNAHQSRLFVDRTLVTFRKLSLASIRAYLSKIHPFDKAGGYAIQEHGSAIVKSIHGSFSNVVGLPLQPLSSALAEFRFPVPASAKIRSLERKWIRQQIDAT